MKYFKILLLIISFSSVSSASIYLGQNDRCIEDYYLDNGTFYYQRSDNSKWYSINNNNMINKIHDGYVYDSTNDICKPDKHLLLGMDIKDYNFLLGLTGVLIGFTFLFFMVYTFINIAISRKV
jgi:hypothetical protein